MASHLLSPVRTSRQTVEPLVLSGGESGLDQSRLALRHTQATSTSATNLRALRMTNGGLTQPASAIELEDVSSPTDNDSLLLPRITLPLGGKSFSSSALGAGSGLGPPGLGSAAGGGGGGQRIDWNVFDQGMRFGCMLMVSRSRWPLRARSARTRSARADRVLARLLSLFSHSIMSCFRFSSFFFLSFSSSPG